MECLGETTAYGESMADAASTTYLSEGISRHSTLTAAHVHCDAALRMCNINKGFALDGDDAASANQFAGTVEGLEG